MKLEYWHMLLDSRRRIRTVQEQLLPAETSGGIAPNRIGVEAMNLLRQRLFEELGQLRSAFGTEMNEGDVNDASLPLTLLVDETVLRRLCEAEQSQWRLIQRQLYGREDGGEHFYEFADEKLRRPDTPAFIFEILHFCLTAGFVGRYVGNTAKLRQYKDLLAARIPRPETSGPIAPRAVEEVPIPEFPTLYYVAAGSVIVALPFVLWWLSN